MKDPISLVGLTLVGVLGCAGQYIPAACVAAALAIRAGIYLRRWDRAIRAELRQLCRPSPADRDHFTY